MDDKLLVRVYNVGCGDCIFVRIPDEDRTYHFLVDCGNFFGDSPKPLQAAVQDIRRMLAEGAPPGTAGQLDLLVATHKHYDHLRGFDPDLFESIDIKRIWLSVAMDEGHDQATGLRALNAFVDEAVRSLQAHGLRLNEGLHAFLMNSLGTEAATHALQKALHQKNGIEPLYVYRGFEAELSDKQRKEQLFDFKDPSIKLHVLAPEKDIDGTYMHHLNAMIEDLEEHRRDMQRGSSADRPEKWPVNISRFDYQRLRTRLLNAGLGVAGMSNHVINNTSVVLLLEWRGRRLLFPGDAQWGYGEDPEGSWEMMWEKETDKLSLPLDFLKVGHHGSVNATPWHPEKPEHPINEILEALLPRPKPGEKPTAQAVVSTRVEKIIYDPKLMAQLGERVAEPREYPDEQPYARQPWRTDKEEAPWIDITIPFEPD